ncbi:carbohydrate kinase family protein [Candidatus Leptofilum sp.]|uniref:carbohydrate kinase family protein n=1 Tax=Candidatus Leptofilum sp. TaxID=3241576 RepID=UPI003B5C98B4
MHIVTLGEILIDMFPAEVGRPLTQVSAFHPKPGGAPANVAVAAHRLGADTAFIGKVGDDIFGHQLIDVLRQEGVETRGMRVDNEARTTMAIIAMPDENTAEFVFYRNPGADLRLCAEELDMTLLQNSRALHIGSLSLVDEPGRTATLTAVATAKENGAFISFDVNYRPSLWRSDDEALAQIEAMIPQVDLVKVNEVELALLQGEETETAVAIQNILAQGPTLCVLTRGQDGSLAQTAVTSVTVPSFQVETVDATGCGDAFIAALLTQLTETADWQQQLTANRLETVLRYANAVGALTAQTQGTIPAMPTAVQVETFLSNQKT